MTSPRPKLDAWAAWFAAQGAWISRDMRVLAALVILLGAGCATDDRASSLPGGRTQSRELNDGGVPFPWDTRGR
jgi:hypothetical protein